MSERRERTRDLCCFVLLTLPQARLPSAEVGHERGHSMCPSEAPLMSDALRYTHKIFATLVGLGA